MADESQTGQTAKDWHFMAACAKEEHPMPRYTTHMRVLFSCLASTLSGDVGFSSGGAMMMLMHAAVTVWVDRGQGGGCARHLGTRA